MKEVINKRQQIGKINLRAVLAEMLKHVAAATCGFLMARGALPGGIMPFGAAFIAAIPSDYLALSALGCFIAYFLPIGYGGAFRYFAALFAIIAIKALVAAVTKYERRPIICALTAGIVSCATGLVSTVGNPEGSLLSVTEAALAFCGALFIARVFGAYPSYMTGANGEDLAALLISVNMLLCGLMTFTPGKISVGKILAIAFILLVSRFGQTHAGAVCGIAAGFASALSGGGLSSALALTLSGLCGGIFASLGKYFQVAAVIISAGVGSLVGAELTETVEILIESLFGSALFLVIPKNIAVSAGRIFSPPAKTVSENGMKKAVTMRLRFAAGALSDVSRTVDTVARELSRINSPDFEGVLKGIEKDACAGCSLCVNCWETKRSDTVSAVLDMVKSVREGNAPIEEQATEEFRSRCLRPVKVGQAVYLHYSDYASRIAAESRIADVRSVVSEQFSGISNMLTDLSDELEKDEAFDERTAAKIVSALKNLDIHATECGCRIDKYGRMSVEIITPAVRGAKYNRLKLLRQLEICCDREFDPPIITETGGSVYITLTERAELTLDTGIFQLPCSPSGICGDAYSSFTDGKGRAFMILSDGMGCGGRAAVDGAMASGLITRLLKSGFGYDCSLSILNSAMLFKSTDESLATVDVACIDLFSGRTDMLKAGAAPTVIRRSGKCGVAQSTSLPAGILREVGFDKATVKLKAGDIIVMMSDGVTAEGTDWICAELEAWQDKSAAQLAEHLAHCARRRRADNHQDDITVLAAIVEKAV